MIKKYFLIISLFFPTYFSFSLDKENGDKVNGISAVIGNEIILDSEVKHYLSSSDKKMTFCEGLENLIIQKLILYHAKKDPNIKVYDQELDSQKKFTNQESFSEELEKLKDNQYIEKYHQKIIKNLEISPKEVKSFFFKNKYSLPKVPKQVRISYMVFYPKLSELHRKKIIDYLKKIKNEIHSDMDFSMKAILLSEDIYSALKGGLIQGIKKEDLSKEFERVVFSLEEKEISEPFETDLGFHLVKLEKKIGNKIDIRHILIKPKYTEEEFCKTKSFIQLVKKRIINHEIIPKTILDGNDIIFIKNPIKIMNMNMNFSFIWKKNLFEENHLSEKMKKALHHLKNGEISDPYKEIINGKEVFFIVKLLERIPFHSISLEKDYPRLKKLVKNIKKKHEIKNWVNNQLKKTYFLKIEKSCT